MKDTQGNIITEEEFTKDIGHKVESHHYCCATQENEGECNCQLIVNPLEDNCKPLWKKRFDSEFVNEDDGLLNIGKYDYERLVSFIGTEKCASTEEESERWSEIVKINKNK